MIDSGIEQELEKNGAYMSTTVGVSMWPMLRNRRDTVIIRPVTAELKRGDVALYRVPSSGKYVLHRVLRVKPDRYIIVGDNCVGLEQVPKEWVLGFLDGFYRGETWVPPEHKGYRVYRAITLVISPVRRRLKALWLRLRSLAGGVKRRLMKILKK